jgi:hypothetical protein
MTTLNDPLASLFASDAKVLDRQKLAELLRPFVVIDESSREFGFYDAFNALKSNAKKIEIILAAAKARALFLGEEDGMPPGDIITLGVMPEGSVKTSLKKLFDNRKINKDKEGRYFIPAYRVPELVKQFNN